MLPSPPASKRKAGFSLLELLAVITILGVLTAAVIPRVSTSAVNAKRKMCLQNQTEIDQALERYFVLEGTLLTELKLLNGPEYFPDGVPVCPVNGAAYTVDPTSHRSKGCSCQN